MSKRIVLYARGIHQGGGAVLLQFLINSIKKLNVSVFYFIDSRLKINELGADVNFIKIKPNILSRLWAELLLKKDVKDNESVICFGNLPPLFKNKGKNIVFLQNKYLVEKNDLTDFGIKSKLRISVERVWIKLFIKNAELYLVQTPTMEAKFRKAFGDKIKVSVAPFLDLAIKNDKNLMLKNIIKGDGDFIYIASGEPHKNHKTLIGAWVLLAKEGIFPSLSLTINEVDYSDTLSFINKRMVEFNLRIKNYSCLNNDQMKEVLSKKACLIFPSLFESFGIPLVEARSLGVPIVASELDFVRDLVDPVDTFDPNSEISIYRAVKRFMGLGNEKIDILSAEEFLDRILRI